MRLASSRHAHSTAQAAVPLALRGQPRARRIAELYGRAARLLPEEMAKVRNIRKAELARDPPDAKFWISHVGPRNQFVRLWGYDSMVEYEAHSLARGSHPDFPKYLVAYEHLVVVQEKRLRHVEMSSVGAPR
jgi:hypothetical protein